VLTAFAACRLAARRRAATVLPPTRRRVFVNGTSDAFGKVEAAVEAAKQASGRD